MTYKTMDDYIIEKLKDPEEAKAYLEAALDDYSDDPDSNALALSLRNLILSRGSVTTFAKEAKINRQHLYKIFDGQSKPQIDTLNHIIRALGFKMSFNIQRMKEAS